MWGMSRMHPPVRRAGIVALFSLLGLLAACQTTPPPARLPEPQLQLLRSEPLTLSSGCDASGSFFVSFTVATSGRTDDIHAPDAPPCVQEALTAWVASFEYAPPAQATPAAIEWLMVSAKRGS